MNHKTNKELEIFNQLTKINNNLSSKEKKKRGRKNQDGRRLYKHNPHFTNSLWLYLLHRHCGNYHRYLIYRFDSTLQFAQPNFFTQLL